MWTIIPLSEIKQIAKANSKSNNNSEIYKGVISKYMEKNDKKGWIFSKKYRNLEFKLREEYDGVDYYGPESHIYDLWVTWNDENYKEQNDIWHREFWYNGEDDEEFELYKYNDTYLSNLMYSYVNRGSFLC